jgi:excisionase family DNA binding protein
MKTTSPVKPESAPRGSESDTRTAWSPPSNETVAGDDNSGDDLSAGWWPNNVPVLALSIKQFCKSANLGTTKVYEEIANGRLKSRKVGRHRIILFEDGQEYLRSLPTE